MEQWLPHPDAMVNRLLSFFDNSSPGDSCFPSDKPAECRKRTREIEFYVGGLRYGSDDLHGSSYPQGAAAEPEWRGDDHDHGHVPQRGAR